MKIERAACHFRAIALSNCCGFLLAGCVGEKEDKSNSDPGARLARALHEVCGPPPVNPRSGDVTVKVKFRDIGDAVLCPFDVDFACPLAFKT
jgi:hypothetical protein